MCSIGIKMYHDQTIYIKKCWLHSLQELGLQYIAHLKKLLISFIIAEGSVSTSLWGQDPGWRKRCDFKWRAEGESWAGQSPVC